MPRTSTAVTSDAGQEALELLTTVPLKIAGVLYAFSEGRPMVGVPREDLLAPLAAIGCSNPSNATQQNRLGNYGVAWFVHNEQRGADARIALTGDGLDAIHDLFGEQEGLIDKEAIRAMVHAITNGSTTEGAIPLSQRKKARLAVRGAGSPRSSPAAEVVVQATLVEETPEETPEKVEAETAVTEEEESEEEEEVAATEEEDNGGDDDNSLRALKERLSVLSKRFEDGVQPDALAEVYGAKAGAFFKDNKRPPTSRESNVLLNNAHNQLFADMTIGAGAVRFEEVSAMFKKLDDAASLSAQVRALEQRASTTAASRQ